MSAPLYKQHMMIDIETTSTKSNAMILSIGAVMFDVTGVQNDWFYSGAQHMYYPTSAFDMDDGTMAWWDNQDRAVREEAFGFDSHPLAMLIDFRDWLKERDPDFIWCKGASFDFPILDHALSFYDLEKLPYKKLRCARTVFELFGVNAKDFIGGGAHNAMNDAIGQAHAMWLALNTFHDECGHYGEKMFDQDRF